MLIPDFSIPKFPITVIDGSFGTEMGKPYWMLKVLLFKIKPC